MFIYKKHISCVVLCLIKSILYTQGINLSVTMQKKGKVLLL